MQLFREWGGLVFISRPCFLVSCFHVSCPEGACKSTAVYESLQVGSVEVSAKSSFLTFLFTYHIDGLPLWSMGM